MPVKVRCGGCEQVLNVPDKARGRTIVCPKCSEKIKVPAGDDAPSSAAAAPAPKQAAKPKAKPAKEDGRFLGGLDDYGIEDQKESICRFCAAPVEEEDEVCPSCGKDLATGQMDKKEKVKRSVAGKSTASFYKNVLRESWEFMLEFKSLAFRTGGILSFFSVMYMACFFMVLYCEKMPPKIFWIAMTIVTAVGGPGWIWFLTRKIVSAHLYGDKIEADRIFYDFFTNVALGLAAFLWPCVVNLPWLLPTATTVYVIAAAELESQYPTPPEVAVKAKDGEQPKEAVKVAEVKPSRPSVFAMVSTPVYIALALGIGFLPVIAFPIATVHMVAKHQHKAWIGWELIKLIFANIGPIFVYHSISFVIALVFGGIAIGTALLFGTLHLFNNLRISGWSASITNWIWALIDPQKLEPGSFMFVLFQMPLMFMFAFLIVVPFMILLGFPLLFQMKVNGLIAKHFSHSLDLDQRIMPYAPAGFWVRFLAFCTDTVLSPLAILIVTHDKRFVMIGLGLAGISGAAAVLLGTDSYLVSSVLPPLFAAYSSWMYFSVSHAGPVRSTLGMEAFGLIAIVDGPNVKQKELDRPMQLKRSSLRWLCVNLSAISGGLSFLYCAFQPEKKAVHDLISKTRIVFEGDK